jgi:ElaB/YqjD/DUF883 family membrane-anchored ribosome-binding protein
MDDKVENGQQMDLEQFLEDIKVVLRDGQELLKAGMSTVRERARAGAETTSRVVKERPYQSVGVVFGLGILLGLVVSTALSRHRSEHEEESSHHARG